MNPIFKALLAVRFIGLRNVLRTVRYSLWRDQLDRRLSVRNATSVQSPGDLLTFTPQPGGGDFRFERATLEVRFLAPDLVRLTWTPGALPLPYALARQEWPSVNVQHCADEAGHHLSTDALRLSVHTDGTVAIADAEGRLLRRDHPPQRSGTTWELTSDFPPGLHACGLGDRAAPPDLPAGTYRLWNRDPGGSYGPGADPLYANIPVLFTAHAQGSLLTFYENPFPTKIALAGDAPRITYRVDDGALRFYLIPGPPERALARYTELTGRPPLPPRWALGFHQSRWGYMNEEQVRTVVEGFRRHDLPISAIHLDIDYMDGYRVFTVNRERFPDLKRLADDLHALGIHLVTILDPGVKRDPHFALYRQGVERGLFCTTPDGRPLHGLVWPGWTAFPDFTHPETRAWWRDQYAALLDAGVDGIWHDMNEPSAFAAWGDPTLPHVTRHRMEGRGGDHREAHNLYGLLMNHAGYEALRERLPDRRPWLLSRANWAGGQRYAWNWTADTESTWDALRMTIGMMIHSSLAGQPYNGPDIGGFSGAPDGELFIRWFQMAAFLPFFRNHAAKGTPPREPWVFGEPYLSIARDILRLRYRLLPYLYTLAWEATERGLPIVRPLWWDAPQREDLWAVDDACLLGSALLVAPVVSPGAETRDLFLPPGRWFHVWDDQIFDGDQTITLPAPLDRIPILARAGAVIPQESGTTLELHLYLPTKDSLGGGQVYLDAGDGYGPHRLERYTLAWDGDHLQLDRVVEGEYTFPYDSIRLFLHGIVPAALTVDDRPLPIDDTTIPLPADFRTLRIFPEK